MIRTITAASILLAGAAPAAVAHGGLPIAQAAQPDIEVTSTDLGDGLHMLVGRGGNLGVLTGPDGVFVIDSQFADIAPANLAKINEIGGGATPRFLVNTHWHGDHVGGNAAFEAAGATIVAHENVRARVSEDQEGELLGQIRKTPASPPEVWPVVTYNQDVALHLNGQTIQVFHVPDAHTDGDSIVFFKEANVVHMGDVMFSGFFPFIDVSSGGTTKGYIAALDYVHGKIDDETQVIPGHGPLSTRADILALADMLRGACAAVEAEIAAGKSLEATIASRPLEQWNEDWGGGFMNEERFTAILYADLSS
ncbi:MAG: MBL fold metallo-hydrolase [Pseudomonadota bacterium]